MNKVLFLLFILVTFLMACNSQSKNDEGKVNAIKYAEESVFNNMTGIKSIEVTCIDSVLIDDIIDEESFSKITNDFANGDVDETTLKTVVDSLSEIKKDIYLTWNGGSRKNDVRGKYLGLWHSIYTVTAIMESGANHNIRVLMAKDGITPYMTEEDFKEQQRKNKGIINAMTNKFNWNY